MDWNVASCYVTVLQCECSLVSVVYVFLEDGRQARYIRCCKLEVQWCGVYNCNGVFGGVGGYFKLYCLCMSVFNLVKF